MYLNINQQTLIIFLFKYLKAAGMIVILLYLTLLQHFFMVFAGTLPIFQKQPKSA
jgi:hypothetical protein